MMARIWPIEVSRDFRISEHPGQDGSKKERSRCLERKTLNEGSVGEYDEGLYKCVTKRIVSRELGNENVQDVTCM